LARWGWSEIPDDPGDQAEVKKKNDEWDDDDDGERPNWNAVDLWKPAPLSQVLTRCRRQSVSVYTIIVAKRLGER
jgi:hypothetical protein